MLVYFMAVWSILWPFGMCNLSPFNSLWAFVYIFPVLVCLDQEKSGKAGLDRVIMIRFRNKVLIESLAGK
jgi:hypothetical protein